MYAADHARRHPDRPAAIFAPSGTTLTFGQLEADANRLAHVYRASGLGRLDHVAFLMENRPELLIAEAAAERTGLYYTCLNSFLGAEEAAYIVNDCGARVVVTTAKKLEVAAQLPSRCPLVERWLVVGADEAPAAFERYEDVVATMPTQPVADERLGWVMHYSSGTTGNPKGIVQPIADVAPGEAVPVMLGVQQMMQMHEGMTYLSPAPLYHSAPQATVAAVIRLGQTAVVMEHFDAALLLDLVERHRVTHIQLVPTMFSRLLKLPDQVRATADVSSLEYVVHAAAPCPVPVKEQMIEWWGPIIYEYFSASEGIGATYCDSHEWLAHRGTVGKPAGADLRILDDDGQPCPVGTPGTIWFAGSTGFEYHNDPGKTAEAHDPTGTMATVGDIGYLDEDGYLFLTDRKSHMIISGGVNIYPQEAENVLVTHPKVLDAAVIGVPNEEFGEEVKAVVQVMPGVEAGEALEQELIEHCRAQLAKFKCPRSVDFTDELPRLPTGKLYKRLLRDAYAAAARPSAG